MHPGYVVLLSNGTEPAPEINGQINIFTIFVEAAQKFRAVISASGHLANQDEGFPGFNDPRLFLDCLRSRL